MGEAKRRGNFEDRKRQSIDAERIRQAEEEIKRKDREQAMSTNRTCATRSKRSMNLAIAAIIGTAAARRL